MVPARLLSALFGLACLVLVQLFVEVSPVEGVQVRAPGVGGWAGAAVLLLVVLGVVWRASRAPGARWVRPLQLAVTCAVALALGALLWPQRERLLEVLALYTAAGLPER